MSLTRKALSAMGIEDEKIDQIIEMHTDVTNALKEERDTYKADAEKLPAVQKELNELKDTAAKVKDLSVFGTFLFCFMAAHIPGIHMRSPPGLV